MKNWNKAIEKYKLESRSFSNADGGLVRSDYIGQKSFIGESHADGGASSMGGDIFSTLNDGNKFYTAVITNTNTTGSAITAIVFGANQYSGSTQANAGVTVTIQESSHAQVRSASQYSPFWINGLRYLTTTSTQLNTQQITIQKYTSAGEIRSVIFRPTTFKTAYQQQSTQIDAPGYKFLVDGDTSVQVPVIANETVTIVFQLGGRFSPENIVNGQSSLAVANQRELSTGLVTVVR